MKETQTYDVVIIGAGIAGLSTADALIQQGLTCAITDKGFPGSGASGAPRLLINPATGRRAKMSLEANESYLAVHDLLKRVKHYSGDEFYEESGVIRPALKAKIGEDFERSPEKYNWPDGWIEWLDKISFQKRFPVFKDQYGGLIIHRGITVEGQRYMNNLSAYLQQLGLSTYYNTEASYIKKNDRWQITLSDGEVLKSNHVICATGTSLTGNPDWEFLKLHLVKGQTATFHFDREVPLSCSVSSMGYLAYMAQTPKKLTVGSTYEHQFEHVEPDDKGLDYLTAKLENNLAGLSKFIVNSEQWAGVRVTSKDRKPIIGEHPKLKGLHVFAALGSKGMILGRFIAEKLAASIVMNKPISPSLSINRFF